jgi:hypothetical protein
VGSSEKGWERTQTAVREEAKTVDGIRGIEEEEIAAKIEEEEIAAKIEGKTRKIQEFRGGIKLSFGVERKYWRLEIYP